MSAFFNNTNRLRGSLALFFLVFLLRIHPFILNPQFFCEDGTVFFVDAYNEGAISLLKPYAGYSVLYQRLVAWLVSFLSPAEAPLFYLLFALMVSLFLLALLLSDLMPFRNRTLAASIFLLAPFDGTVLATLVNTQWLFGLMLLLFCIARPQPRARVLLLAPLLALASLTGPSSALLAPAFVLRLLYERNYQTKLFALIVSACGLIQLLILSATYESRVVASLVPENILWIKAISSLFYYPWFRATNDLNLNQLLLVILVVIACIALLLEVYRSILRKNIPELICIFAAFSFASAALWSYSADPEFLLYRERYALIPCLGLAWGVLLSHRLLGQAFFMFPLLVLGVLNFSSAPLKDLRWPEQQQCIGGESTCEIPLHWEGRFIRFVPGPSNSSGRPGSLKNISGQARLLEQKRL